MTAALPSPVGATYVPASADRPLAPGEKVADLFAANFAGDYVLQRLTARTYWVQRYFCATTFYVGDEGVLLLDPLEGHGDAILAAIRSVTDLPVTMLVYSHAHADHLADAAKVLDAVGDVPVVASSATADKLAFIGSGFPPPTRTIAWPDGELRFEGLTVRLHGFERAAHADDHAAWLLVEERVLHAPDLLNGDQPPFWHLAGSENFVYLPGNLREADALEWDWLNGGHGNIAGHEDAAYHLAALEDYREAAAAAMAAHPFTDFVDPSAGAHTGFMTAWLDAVVTDAAAALRPRYGAFYGFDAGIRSNLELVAHTLLSYR